MPEIEIKMWEVNMQPIKMKLERLIFERSFVLNRDQMK